MKKCQLWGSEERKLTCNQINSKKLLFVFFIKLILSAFILYHYKGYFPCTVITNIGFIPCVVQYIVIGLPRWFSGLRIHVQCRRRGRCEFKPWAGKIPWRSTSNSLQYSCLENPMERGARRAAAHTVAKSWTQLKRWSTHTRTDCLKPSSLCLSLPSPPSLSPLVMLICSPYL